MCPIGILWQLACTVVQQYKLSVSGGSRHGSPGLARMPLAKEIPTCEKVPSVESRSRNKNENCFESKSDKSQMF